MLISRVTRSTSDLLSMRSFSKILMATFSPVIVWVPTLTFPNVPYPSDRPNPLKIEWLTNNVMPNCPSFLFFKDLGSCLSSLSFLLHLTFREISIGIRNPKIFKRCGITGFLGSNSCMFALLWNALGLGAVLKSGNFRFRDRLVLYDFHSCGHSALHSCFIRVETICFF